MFKQVCHRDLKLENTLLDGSDVPRLKICDFGYSKSSVLHSQPKSTVGTPAYIAPEVLLKKEYDGKDSARTKKSISLPPALTQDGRLMQRAAGRSLYRIGDQEIPSSPTPRVDEELDWDELPPLALTSHYLPPQTSP
ncbi:hypothetical protein C2845_PM03G09560 [Panicum miliaceum]|uniref:non-specific serine/threonine protein kinase n=1 Tax=Panicum miliaceum TaxID=4540 RepID=A0A3L6TBV6_PANMI|nr:hypothetical protein C2845_PM03G09560 [Panicum miliaceum]